MRDLVKTGGGQFNFERLTATLKPFCTCGAQQNLKIIFLGMGGGGVGLKASTNLPLRSIGEISLHRSSFTATPNTPCDTFCKYLPLVCHQGVCVAIDFPTRIFLPVFFFRNIRLRRRSPLEKSKSPTRGG